MTARLPLSSKVFFTYGVWLAGLGGYFLRLRPSLLPEDLRFIGASPETLRMAAPALDRWLSHVFNVMGGIVLATGATTMLVACQCLAQRQRGTLATMSVAGGASVALMSATNFLLQSDFRWLLLPALLWLVGLLCYLRENGPSTQPATGKPDWLS